MLLSGGASGGFWELPRAGLSSGALMGEGSGASCRFKICHKNPRREVPVSTCTFGDPCQQNGRELPAEARGRDRFTEALH